MRLHLHVIAYLICIMVFCKSQPLCVWSTTKKKKNPWMHRKRLFITLVCFACSQWQQKYFLFFQQMLPDLQGVIPGSLQRIFGSIMWFMGIHYITQWVSRTLNCFCAIGLTAVVLSDLICPFSFHLVGLMEVSSLWLSYFIFCLELFHL